MTTEERRLVPRYELALPVQIGDVRGTTRNMSLDGVLFVAPARYARGESIRMTLFVRASAGESVMRLEGEGTVLRSDPVNGGESLTAVRFDELRVLTDVPRTGAGFFAAP